MVNLALKWIAVYHGPNPCAHSAVVVGDTQDRLAPEWIEVLEWHSECSPEYVQEQELLHRIQRSDAERIHGT